VYYKAFRAVQIHCEWQDIIWRRKSKYFLTLHYRPFRTSGIAALAARPEKRAAATKAVL
jgi:hypothetical protein